MAKKIANFLENKGFRFIICGGITAAFNVILLEGLIKSLNIATALGRNLANVLAIEVSLIFSFWVYKLWVWSQSSWNWRTIIFREIILYHASMLFVISLRIFLIFPLLDWLGVKSIVNTLIGIALGSIISYFFSDRIVFKD
jgi:putative flippase GtrA